MGLGCEGSGSMVSGFRVSGLGFEGLGLKAFKEGLRSGRLRFRGLGG